MSPSQGSTGSSAFKDNIDVAAVARLASAFSQVDPELDVNRFARTASEGLAELELKARVAHVADALVQLLPVHFDQAVRRVDGLLELDLQLELEPGDDRNTGSGQLVGWDLWPVVAWVPLVGRDHHDEALELLARLTGRASAEFAIRPFIDDNPAGVLERLEDWALHGDEHVRRLVSEGTRPKLPWAPKLQVSASNPGYAVGLLDQLVGDPSEYVRRSVSNHLNDLCRVDPTLALEVAQRWNERARQAEQAGDTQAAERLRWVIRRGLRTLVKAGDPAAMRLLGHDPDVALEAELHIESQIVQFGAALEFTLRLRSSADTPQRLVIDYAIHHVRANGSRGRKVFKWTTVELVPGEQVELLRRHPIVAITTRKYYSGEHLVEAQVNGRVVADGEFSLVISS